MWKIPKVDFWPLHTQAHTCAHNAKSIEWEMTCHEHTTRRNLDQLLLSEQNRGQYKEYHQLYSTERSQFSSCWPELLSRELFLQSSTWEISHRLLCPKEGRREVPILFIAGFTSKISTSYPPTKKDCYVEAGSVQCHCAASRGGDEVI